MYRLKLSHQGHSHYFRSDKCQIQSFYVRIMIIFFTRNYFLISYFELQIHCWTINNHFKSIIFLISILWLFYSLYYKQLFKISAQNKIENILYSFCTVINDMSISTASFINCIYFLCLLSKCFISSFIFLFISAADIVWHVLWARDHFSFSAKTSLSHFHKIKCNSI